MAKLRMTYKNLKALRKTKEYQALLVDLVANNIVPKSVAENLLGYNIPANLIGGTEPDNEEQGSGSGTEGSGTEGSGSTVTLLYFAPGLPGSLTPTDEWKTATYALTGEDTAAAIITAAQEAFDDDTIDTISFVELDDTYVEGTSSLADKYIALDPQPEAFANSQLIKCFKTVEAVEGN